MSKRCSQCRVCIVSDTSPCFHSSDGFLTMRCLELKQTCVGIYTKGRSLGLSKASDLICRTIRESRTKPMITLTPIAAICNWFTDSQTLTMRQMTDMYRNINNSLYFSNKSSNSNQRFVYPNEWQLKTINATKLSSSSSQTNGKCVPIDDNKCRQFSTKLIIEFDLSLTISESLIQWFSDRIRSQTNDSLFSSFGSFECLLLGQSLDP